MHSTNSNAEQTGQHEEQQRHCVRLQHDNSNEKAESLISTCKLY